jgi:hypothetical protein
MSKFDVYAPVADADYHQFIGSVYAESEEEAEKLAEKLLSEVAALDVIAISHIL